MIVNWFDDECAEIICDCGEVLLLQNFEERERV